LWGSGIIDSNVSGNTTTRLFIGNGDKDGVFDGTLQNETSTHILALTKTGAGTQVLNGPCTFTGSTSASGGTLQINNDYASSVAVGSGATVGGTGTLGSTLTATAVGATVAPGASTGTLTVTGTANLSSGGILAIEIDDTATLKNDKLVALGTLDITNATLDVTVNGAAGQPAYIIASYSSLTGEFGTINAPGFTVDYAYDDGVSTNNIALVSTGGGDYAGWESFYGIAGAGPAADSDGDTLSNAGEYAFGLDPTSGSSVTPTTVPLNKQTGKFTYTRRKPSLTGLGYSIETSLNLAGWAVDAGATESVTAVVGDVETVEVTVSAALLTAPKLFVRVLAAQ
jgi:autotransporter-associated beta strand protein